MDLLSDQELDSLTSLEDRIYKAAQLVSQLRQEKDSLLKDARAAEAAKEAAQREAAEARAELNRFSQELESLRAERVQVRTRIEKLLGQMDVFGG